MFIIIVMQLTGNLIPTRIVQVTRVVFKTIKVNLYEARDTIEAEELEIKWHFSTRVADKSFHQDAWRYVFVTPLPSQIVVVHL